MAIKTDKIIGKTIESLDGAFSIEIKDLGTGDLSNAVVSGSFDAATQTLTLTKGDNSTIDIDLSSLSGGTDTNTYITGAELSGTILKLTRNDGQEFNVNLASIDTKDAESIKGKQIDTLPTEPLILMYNPNTQKFEFTALPSCEQGNIIVPTYTRVETGLTAADVEQMIANRIAALKANESRGIEPIRYICLEPNNIVPINKGAIEYVKKDNSLNYDRRYIQTNGDLIYSFFTDSNDENKWKVKIVDFDFNEIGIFEIVDANGNNKNPGDFIAIAKNGKRFFCDYGIFDFDNSTNTYKYIQDTPNTTNNESKCNYKVNSCGNMFFSSNYNFAELHKLNEAGTWEEIKIYNQGFTELSFSGYGFKLAIYRTGSYTFNIIEFDDNYDFTVKYTIDTSNDTDSSCKRPTISQDGKLITIQSNGYTLVYIYDEESDSYKIAGKFKGGNNNDRLDNTALIKNDTSILAYDVYSRELQQFKLNMTPSMYCSSQKTYTLDETIDLTQGNIALNSVESFCRDKRNAANSNARTFFLNDNEANTGDIFFIDVINDSKQLILNAGNSVKYMVQKDNYLLLQLEDNSLKYYDISDLDNTAEIALPDLSAYSKIYIQNCDIFNGDLTISARDDDNNRYLDYYILDTANNTFTKDTNKSTTSNLTQQRYWQNNKNIEAYIESFTELDTNAYLYTEITVADSLGNNSTITIDTGGKSATSMSYKIIGDMLVFYAANVDENFNTTSYDLLFVCIEDINNIKFIEQAEYVSDGSLTDEQVFMLFNEYNKSQKTIFKYKDNSTLEVFSLLI